jgi:hypothetical protein
LKRKVTHSTRVLETRRLAAAASSLQQALAPAAFQMFAICHLCLEHYYEHYFRCIDTEKVIMNWDFDTAAVFRDGSIHSNQNNWVFLDFVHRPVF